MDTPMLQRPRLTLSRPLLLAPFLALSAPPLRGQTAVPDENGRLVFKANVRTVVLDVVITGRDGKPVQGLHKEDFQVSEDGHPQAINFFEEHTGAHRSPRTKPVSSTTAEYFHQHPRVPPSDAVTVLPARLDEHPAGRTRCFVHAQMLKYLKNIPLRNARGHLYASATACSSFRGLPTMPPLLSAALSNPKLGGWPGSLRRCCLSSG